MTGDAAPQRRIARPEHLGKFLESATFEALEAFLQDLGGAAEGKTVYRQERLDSLDGALGSALAALAEAEHLLEEFPRLQQASRFGNAAFRDWLGAVRESSEALMRPVAEAHAKELAGYWWNSFGNGKRLDYGTGHECSFLVWMFALREAGAVDDLEALALGVFPRYLELAFKVQTQYRLEPAGSHGVWSLDDYHSLPFLIGSSQLSGTGGRSMAPTPKAIRNSELVECLAQDNLFMRAVQRSCQLKTGPFEEHSPLLADLSSNIKTWKDLYTGMVRMYVGEVLGKFPVAQHFLFGPLFPSTWELSAEELEALDNPEVSGTPQYTSPFAMAAASAGAGTGDPLLVYFKVQRKPLLHGAQGAAAPAPMSRVAGPAGAGPVGTAAPGPVGASAMGPREFEIKGWKVSTNKARISSDAEMEEARSDDLDFPLPEMLFGSNYVRVVHQASGVALDFNAYDAVRGCKIQRDADGVPDRSLFKLANASKWAERTDFNGKPIKEWRDDYDWTYTTTYTGSLHREGAADGAAPTKRESEQAIDVERLKRRDPILFYDAVQLFEDDLFDNGESKYSVKLRVMPSCLFVLARFWLRVDNTFVRCFDTRVYHAFGSDVLLIESKHREATAEALAAEGVEGRDLMDEATVEPMLKAVAERMFEVPLAR